MEEAKVKKEIVVKRLSAFKFEVEVNPQAEAQQPARVSVIQKAPPTLNSSPLPVTTAIEPIRHAILYHIVEILLWKLLGERRLRLFCGYPTASPCALLRRVVHLSTADAGSNISESQNCKQTVKCFLDHVTQLLEICAPTEVLWSKFGWNNLSGEAILRKIYEEELSPNMQTADLLQNENIARIYEETQLLMQWERRGCSAVERQQRKGTTTLLPIFSPTVPHFPTKADALGRFYKEDATWREGSRPFQGGPETRYANYPTHALRSIRHHRVFSKPPYFHKTFINRSGLQHYRVNGDRQYPAGQLNEIYRSQVYSQQPRR